MEFEWFSKVFAWKTNVFHMDFSHCFSYTMIFPGNPVGEILITVHSAVGIFMILVILARFTSLIPPPETSDGLKSSSFKTLH